MKIDSLSEISILMCISKEDNPKYLIKALESLREKYLFFYELIIVQDCTLTEALNKVINNFRKLIKIRKLTL